MSRVAARPAVQRVRRHISLHTAIDAFQLQPPEVIRNQELLCRVAAHSYRKVDGSWQLKADRHVFRRVDHDVVARNLAATTVPITEIWGESSPVVTEEVLKFLADTHPGPTDCVALPGGHHLLFDHAPRSAVVKARWDSLTRLLANRARQRTPVGPTARVLLRVAGAPRRSARVGIPRRGTAGG